MILQVTHFMRRPGARDFSIERLFEDVRAHMPVNIRVKVHTNRFFSQGVRGRLLDALGAVRQHGDVNHVTGDVHYLTFFLSRRRTVLTILDCVSLERSRGIKFWLLWLFWYWLPAKRCAAIPVISEATRQQVLRYLRCDPAKVRVIHCNVSDEFQPELRPFNAFFPRILHIGTRANKNLERHAAALEGIECQLSVVGELSDPQRSELERYCIQYENVVGLSREALVDEYKRCDLLLFASIYEGFGLPIVEAQSVGRPVVAGNLWSMPEVAGDAACLVDPFDVQCIRAGVQRVIVDADYRESLIRLGFKNVERFRAKTIAAQYAALYREIYEQSNRSRRKGL